MLDVWFFGQIVYTNIEHPVLRLLIRFSISNGNCKRDFVWNLIWKYLLIFANGHVIIIYRACVFWKFYIPLQKFHILNYIRLAYSNTNVVKLETSWRVDFALAWMVHPLSVLIVLLPRLLVLSAFDFCLSQWLYENLLYSMEFHEFIAYKVMLRGFNLTSPLDLEPSFSIM